MALERQEQHPTATIHSLSTYRAMKGLPPQNNKPIALSDRLASRVTGGLGTWKYMMVQFLLFLTYIILNSLPGVYHFDPYPYLYLNLLMGTIGAFSVPLIVLSQKQQVAENHVTALHTEHLVEHLAHVDEQVVRTFIHLIQMQATANHHRPTQLDNLPKP